MNSILGLAPPNWVKKSIDDILENMIMSIKNVSIYYEVLIVPFQLSNN